MHDVNNNFIYRPAINIDIHVYRQDGRIDWLIDSSGLCGLMDRFIVSTFIGPIDWFPSQSYCQFRPTYVHIKLEQIKTKTDLVIKIEAKSVHSELALKYFFSVTLHQNTLKFDTAFLLQIYWISVNSIWIQLTCNHLLYLSRSTQRSGHCQICI